MPPKTRAEAKAETREALLTAALRLFSEQGLDGPSLDAICAEAGYTRGAFYVHFGGRGELQLAVMERVLRAWTAVIVQTADDAGGDLARSIDTFVATFLGVLVDPDADVFLRLGTANVHLMLAAARRDPAVGERLSAMLSREAGRVAEIIVAARDAGTVRADVDPAAAADLLVTLVLGVLAMMPVGYPRGLAALRQAVLTLLAP